MRRKTASTSYVEHAPFQVKGLVMSDNGKVEALHRTLKYQCFPVVAGNVADWATLASLLDTWMTFYNNTRAHNGWINKGLPPLAFVSL